MGEHRDFFAFNDEHRALAWQEGKNFNDRPVEFFKAVRAFRDVIMSIEGNDTRDMRNYLYLTKITEARYHFYKANNLTETANSITSVADCWESTNWCLGVRLALLTLIDDILAEESRICSKK